MRSPSVRRVIANLLNATKLSIIVRQFIVHLTCLEKRSPYRIRTIAISRYAASLSINVRQFIVHMIF